jgi:CBS domain-containing protein
VPVSARPPLPSVLAREAMHAPVVACDASATVAEVASMMASHRVHALIVEDISAERGGERLHWAVVSDLDLLRAAVLGDDATTAGAIAGTESLTVDADDDLAAVAGFLTDHDCAHAIVVEDGRPAGVISTLDLASVLAG